MCIRDRFGGSGNFGIACLNTNRNAIIVEKDEQTFERMKDNIVNTIDVYKRQILECPFFRTEEGRCINVNDCHMMGEMPRQEVNVLKEYLSRKEIYI